MDKTDWKDSLGDYTEQGEQSAGYYLKETATGAVTDKKTVTFKIDTGMPSGSIRIGENTFDSSLKNITYGYWFKDKVSVDITGADSASGIASVEYQAVSAEESYDANGTWLPWNAEEKLSLTESGRYVVYARVTDNAGNQTIVNSDGVAVFKDSVVVDSSIDYTRTTKASVDAKVTLNGNTVASVRNGETTLTEGKDYTVFEDRITFSGEYLDTLEAGTYKLTVAYHPQGVTEYKGGDKPADSQIAVNVSRQTANVKITGTLDKEYDGQPADLAYTTNSNVNIKVEYNVNGTWQTEAPIHAGTYEVRVSVSENGDFTAASDTKAYTIRQREVVISGITAKGKVYDGTADAELDYSKAVFAGAVKGDSLTVSAEGTFADSNAAKGKTVTITKPVLGGGSAGDYILADNGQQTSTTADISPKEITVKITPNGGIYEGTITPATAVLNGLVGEDDPEIILTYAGRANDGTAADGKVPSKAGTYTVTASIKDSNYSLKEDGSSAEFTIKRADPQLSVSAVKDKKYGEEAFKLEVSNKGDGVKTYASSNNKVVTVDKNGVVTIVGAGTATLTVSLAQSANYTADQKEVTVTVVPKEITVKITPNGGTYEGTITPATAVLNGLVGEDDPEIILTYAGKANDGTEVNGTEVPSLAGTYTVTATIKDKNYSLKPEGSSAEFVVAKADPALSVSEVTDKDYGEETFRLNVSNKGDGLKTYASSDDKVVAVDENGMVTIAGTGTATLTVFLAETANYTAAQKEVTITVRKLGHSLVVDKLSYKVTYGDPAFKITAKAKDTESAIRFASDNKEVATVSEDGTVTIRNAGTAKITVSMDESQNYLAVSREVIITVAPKNITVTADNKNKIAGKADPVLTYTAKGLVGEDTLSGITVKRKAGEKVGIYPITVSQASGSNPNYRITFRKGIFTIEQADQSKLSGKDVYRLKLPVFFAAGKAQKNSIVVSWRKYPGAAGYDVFWCYCDGSINYKKAGTVKNGKLSMTHKNLKSNREYKYFVAAYKMVKGRKIYIAKSNEVHVAMKKARTTNAFSIKVNRTTVILKPGKTFRLKCQLTSENRKKKLLSHPSSYRYYTTDSKVATVSQNGVIRAKAKGSCSIYILASNGVYKRVTVKVK